MKTRLLLNAHHSDDNYGNDGSDSEDDTTDSYGERRLRILPTWIRKTLAETAASSAPHTGRTREVPNGGQPDHDSTPDSDASAKTKASNESDHTTFAGSACGNNNPELSHASLPEDLLCIKGYGDPRVAKTACGNLTLSDLCRTATGIGSTSRRPEVCPVRHRYVLGLRAGHAKLCASCNPGDEGRVEERWTHEYERYRSDHVDFVS